MLNNPHPFFNAEKYREHYGKELEDFSGSAYEHFILRGRRKGYSPFGVRGVDAKEMLPGEFIAKLSSVERLLFEYLFTVSITSREATLLIQRGDPDRILYLDHQPLRQKTAILIPFFENWEITANCLRSLSRCWDVDMRHVFLVDDGSSSSYESDVAAIDPNVRYLRNEENLGYLRISNWAFLRIRETGLYSFVFLLNNDTTPIPGFLAESIAVVGANDKVGLVGSKLVYPDGLIQEAGGIVWRDGSAWNFGRFTRPSIQTEYSRPVDYCSAAAALVRVESVQDVLFDPRYVPAYYEDTDLAFRLREEGWEVLYCPLSIVVHSEGGTHGTDTSTGLKSHQVLNQSLFAQKWQAQLSDHYPPHPELAATAANRPGYVDGPRTIIWVDSQLPHPLRDSGSIRAIRLLEMTRELGFFVVFLAQLPSDVSTSWLSSIGVPVAKDLREAKSFLERLGRYPDKIWISRVTVFDVVSRKAEKLFPGVGVIFDTVDLHFVRLEREARLTGKASDALLASKTKTAELAAMTQVEQTVVVSEWERGFLQSEFGITNVSVVSNVHDVRKDPLPQDQRKGLVFVGSFNHHPNESGIKWFLTQIWPLLEQPLRDEGIDIVGQNPPVWLRAMGSEQIRVHGWVSDSELYVRSARFSVAPLLVGAGVKGKVGEAIQCGTCVVTTLIGAEGMGLANGESAIVSDDPAILAEGMNRLAFDPKARQVLVNRSIYELQSRTSSEVVKESLASILEVGPESPVYLRRSTP
jgi:GT2 family glycosyltransferase